MKTFGYPAAAMGVAIVMTLGLRVVCAAEGARLSIARENTTVVLSWTGTALLESAPQLQGPWVTVPTAGETYRVNSPSGMAFYRLRPLHTLTVQRSGQGIGTVRSTPAGIDCGSDCSETLVAGSRLSLQALPAEGSVFEGWTGDCSGTGECAVTLDAARSVTALFSPAPSSNPIVNGDFELGPLVGWEQSPGQVIFPASTLGNTPPHSGNFAAYLGPDRDGRRQVLLGQQVTLPNRTPLYLNFAAWILSQELCDVPWYDRITIYINGQIIFREDRVCGNGGTTTDGWVRYSVDVSALAGQSMAFAFEIYSADALSSALLLDDIAISDVAWGL